MIDKEILEKAIQKAIDRGWTIKKPLPKISPYSLSWDSLDDIQYWQTFVYSRDFVTAIWNSDLVYEGAFGTTNASWDGDRITDEEFIIEDSFVLAAWQYHLQQMVIADDPIKYLGEHLDD